MFGDKIMLDGEKTIIPLDDAHEFLSMFGIGPNSRGYQRWRRDDGFRLVDFEGVLNESSFVLGMDWRGWLQETLQIIADQLANFDITITAELDEEGNQGTLCVDGKVAYVKYVPNDEDNFDDVVANLNLLIGSRAHYRKFCSCEGSDGWEYAVLSNEDWQALQNAAAKSVGILFKDVEGG